MNESQSGRLGNSSYGAPGLGAIAQLTSIALRNVGQKTRCPRWPQSGASSPPNYRVEPMPPNGAQGAFRLRR